LQNARITADVPRLYFDWLMVVSHGILLQRLVSLAP
jgi:hypothetical protein